MQIIIPHPINAYVQATNERDNDAFGALFTEDAIVHDEGQEHRGLSRSGNGLDLPSRNISSPLRRSVFLRKEPRLSSLQNFPATSPAVRY
jgi:hypothetical protein